MTRLSASFRDPAVIHALYLLGTFKAPLNKRLGLLQIVSISDGQFQISQCRDNRRRERCVRIVDGPQWPHVAHFAFLFPALPACCPSHFSQGVGLGILRYSARPTVVISSSRLSAIASPHRPAKKGVSGAYYRPRWPDRYLTAIPVCCQRFASHGPAAPCLPFMRACGPSRIGDATRKARSRCATGD